MEIKHPVSQLQELMAGQHKEMPIYQIADISTNGFPSYHCAVYVTIDNTIGTGVAASKQCAKKAAAVHALVQLGYTVNDVIDPVCSNTKIIKHEVVTTTVVNYNAIGKLNELVAQQRLPYPCYNENGFNKSGAFVMICKLLDHECRGCGATKKAAKQMAAHSMLTLIEEEKIIDIRCPVPSIIDKTDISDDIILHKFNKLRIKLETPRLTEDDAGVDKLNQMNSNIYKERKSEEKAFSIKDLNAMSKELKALNVNYSVDILDRNPYTLVLIFQNEANTTVVDSGDTYDIAYFNTLRRALQVTSVW